MRSGTRTNRPTHFGFTWRYVVAMLAATALLVTACGSSEPSGVVETTTTDLAESDDGGTSTTQDSTEATAEGSTSLPPLEIEMIGQGSPTLLQHTLVEVPYVEETIPERSDGSITANLSTRAERNLTGPQQLDILSQGQVDISMLTDTFLAGDVPFIEAPDLPGLNPTGTQAREAADSVADIVNEQLEPFGVTKISSFPYPSQVIYCKEPVETMSDLQGRQIRTFGAALGDWVAAAGAEPSDIAFAEVYTALDRGVVDCAVTGTATGNSVAWYEVTDHLFAIPLGWAMSGYYVNTEWWESLDADTRDFLEESLLDLSDEITELSLELDEDGIACNEGNADACQYGTLATADDAMQVARPNESDLEEAQGILEDDVLPSWVNSCGSGCGDLFNDYVTPITGVHFGE